MRFGRVILVRLFGGAAVMIRSWHHSWFGIRHPAQYEPLPERRALLCVFTRKFHFVLFEIEHHIDVVL
jgi:hypothetical protein